jgi:hypothetical protein
MMMKNRREWLSSDGHVENCLNEFNFLVGFCIFLFMKFNIYLWIMSGYFVIVELILSGILLVIALMEALGDFSNGFCAFVYFLLLECF